jgi:hypothetical protein
MTCQQILSSAGLVLDIAGCIIIFFNGTPSRAYNTFLELEEPLPPKEQAFNSKIETRSQIGVIILIVGFILQLIPNIIPPSLPIK